MINGGSNPSIVSAICQVKKIRKGPTQTMGPCEDRLYMHTMELCITWEYMMCLPNQCTAI